MAHEANQLGELSFPENVSDPLAELNIIFASKKDQLRSIVKKFLRNDADTDDCLQDGYVKATNKIRTFDVTQNMYAWLSTIMVHHALDMLRMRRNNVEVEDRAYSQLQHTDTPEIAIMDAEQKAIIGKSISQLPPHYEPPIYEHYFNGLNYEEIATKYSTTLASVINTLARARATLRQKLLEVELH